MCGIAGAFGLRPEARPDRARVEQMSCAIAHRGPDGNGIWSNGRVCLAHRRLSIIDLDTGDQPMLASDGGSTIVFNGEIYNYIELRQELEAEGVSFRTESDTEVLLRLYERDGLDCVHRLRGMFAFAIHDAANDRLVLARDRIGKKPLYYAIDGDCLYFASTFGAVRSILAGRAGVDPAMVVAFLNLAYIPAPRTIDPRISKLEAGTLVSVSGGHIETRRFWDAGNRTEPFEGSWTQAVDRLDDLLQTAVAIRMRSDVPLGVFLSGGIDSSLVAAIAARAARTRVLTFSIGFDVQRFDESPYAAEVARRIGSEHRSFRVRWNGMDLLPAIVRHYGEPFGDSSALPTWLLSAETRRHVTVAVGGDGGDEAFGGYDWYRTATRLDRFRRALTPGLASFGARALSRPARRSNGLARVHRGLALLALNDPERYGALRSFTGHDEAKRLYGGLLAEAWQSRAASGQAHVESLFRSSTGSSLTRMRIVDVKSYLADDLMPKVDIASMAHALEVRAPLLDHHVVDFALSLPDAWISNATQGKRILRAVLARYLPASLFERPKQGFSLPLEQWFRHELRPLVDRLPGSAPLLDTGWFRPEGIRALIDEHANGQRDHTHRLYNLLVLEEWLRQA